MSDVAEQTTEGAPEAGQVRRQAAVVGEIPFAGRALVRELVAADWGARVLCPDAAAEAAVREIVGANAEHVAFVRGSLASEKEVAAVLEGAYAVAFVSPITLRGRLYRGPQHLDDMARAIEAGQRQAIRKFVYHSNLCAHPKARALALRQAAQAEELLRDSKCVDYRLRTSVLMGPADGFMSEIVQWAAHSGPVMGMLGYGTTPVQPLHIDDFARCALRLMADQRELLAPGVYALMGPQATSPLNLTDAALEALGKARLKVHLPLFLAGLVATLTGNAALHERVALALEGFCAEQNDAVRLSGSKLLTPQAVQQQLLATLTPGSRGSEPA